MVALVLSAVLSASTWFYMDYILKAQQVADAAAHNRPRGNLSDLYPRWLGARELLLHGRNPYSAEITREIQQGYYGRPLDPSKVDDPKDEQGFAYPAYVVFLLAPAVNFPFPAARVGFRWLLIALTAASVLLWLRVVRWRISQGMTVILGILMLGWLPVVQGLKLDQLTLLVAGMLSASTACVASGWFFSGGVLLALATIKPQLAWPLVFWFCVWSIGDWRRRRRLIFGFALVMAILLAGAEVLLPGWLGMFVSAIGQYHRYTHNQSVLISMFGTAPGRVLEVLSVGACALLAWSTRKEASKSIGFGRATALVMALTVVIVPMFAPYNQVLLAPAIFVLASAARQPEHLLPAIRLAAMVGLGLLAWPWIATLGLAAAYPWLTPELRQHIWAMPFYSNFMLPVFVLGLAALDIWMNPASGLRDAASAE